MKRLILILTICFGIAKAQNIVITPTTAPLGYASTTAGYFTSHKFYYGNWKDSLNLYLFKSDTSVFARKVGLFTKSQADALYRPISYVPTWTSITGKPTFSTVATSGAYADLSGKPTIPAAQVQSDWNASTGIGVILNKPTVKRIVTYSGVTSTISGNVGRYSVTYATPFATIPIVLPSIQANSDYMQQFRIVSSSTSGFVIECGIRAVLNVLAVTVLSSEVTPTNGIAIDVVVVEN